MPTPSLPHSERPWKNVCVTMPTELHETLIEIAQQRDIAVSALVREVLEEAHLRPQKIKSHGWFVK